MNNQLPRDESEQAMPGFDEPWQAQAHAISQVLLDSGLIAADAWSQALGAAIKNRLASGARDTPATYYAALTDALETTLNCSDLDLLPLIEAWRQAYENTPPGQPVRLGATRDNLAHDE